MEYEKISLVKDENLKEYYLIKEMTLEKYHSKYVVFTDDVEKEEMDIFVMKVLADGTLENVVGEELADCKKSALGGEC